MLLLSGLQYAGAHRKHCTYQTVACLVHAFPHEGSINHMAHKSFRSCFTLFPKCLSPFAHATCALSDQCPYSVLAGIHLLVELQYKEALLLEGLKAPFNTAADLTGL